MAQKDPHPAYANDAATRRLVQLLLGAAPNPGDSMVTCVWEHMRPDLPEMLVALAPSTIMVRVKGCFDAGTTVTGAYIDKNGTTGPEVTGMAIRPAPMDGTHYLKVVLPPGVPRPGEASDENVEPAAAAAVPQTMFCPAPHLQEQQTAVPSAPVNTSSSAAPVDDLRVRRLAFGSTAGGAPRASSAHEEVVRLADRQLYNAFLTYQTRWQPLWEYAQTADKQCVAKTMGLSLNGACFFTILCVLGFMVLEVVALPALSLATFGAGLCFALLVLSGAAAYLVIHVFEWVVRAQLVLPQLDVAPSVVRDQSRDARVLALLEAPGAQAVRDLYHTLFFEPFWPWQGLWQKPQRWLTLPPSDLMARVLEEHVQRRAEYAEASTEERARALALAALKAHVYPSTQ